jgi:hypothetical protein
VFDIHNGDDKHHLKNESSARAVPVHSELVRAGLLDYVKALPQDGLLFPGLTRRASKGDKIGARVGELFRKKLEALDLKRKGLCFHSFRHTVAGRLEAAGLSEGEAARMPRTKGSHLRCALDGAGARDTQGQRRKATLWWRGGADSLKSAPLGVPEALGRAGVVETDAARVLGHDIPGMSFGTYSNGPGLKRLREVVEQIRYKII